jgi:phage gp29-like protein
MAFFSWLRAFLFGAPAVTPQARQLPAASSQVETFVFNPGESLRAAIDRAVGEVSGSPPKGEIPDIPLTSFANWSLAKARAAVDAFVIGNFSEASLLAESIQADDRVQNALNGRLKGVTKCELSLEPVDGFEEVAEELKALYPKLFPQAVVEAILTWAVFMGFCLVELIWEADPKTDRWLPRLKVWHPYFIFYRVDLRRYMVSTLDGLIEVDPEDPKWLLFTPYDAYRGWMRGAVRSIWGPWFIRQLGLRDWASANEIFGIPVRVLKVPSQFSDGDKARVTSQVANMGNKTVISLPSQGGPDGVDFDLKVLETDPTAWKTFPGIIAQAEQSITLVLRGTNLTTSVEGGSFAATMAHRDEDEDYATSDRKKFSQAIDRVLSLFCLYNHGTTDVCPDVSLISPEVNKKDEAIVLKGIADAVSGLKAAGFNVDSNALAERFGVPLLPVDPSADDDTPNTIQLSVEDVGKIVTVNEGRGAQKLGPLKTPEGADDPDGYLTIEQFSAKHSTPASSPLESPAPQKPQNGSSPLEPLQRNKTPKPS